MIENQRNTMENVQLFVQLKELGAELCTIRKSIPQSQQNMTELTNLDRRMISAIESGTCLNIKAIYIYCDVLGIELNLTAQIH